MQGVPEDDLFAIDDLAGHDLPDGTVIARNRNTGAQMPLPGPVFNAITHCDQFRTMGGHIANLAGPAAQGREGEIHQILQSVIDGGLMISAATIAARLEPQPPRAVEQLPVVAILTCDRPQALGRLLDSVLENCDLARVARIIVIDDSREQASLGESLRAIDHANEALTSSGQLAIEHFTPADASALVRNLTERLPEHEAAIRFLLDREGRTDQVTTGIARNLAQLHGAGHPLLVFDDDVLCSVMEAPESGAGVEFSGRQRGCRFYASDEEWQDMRADERLCPVTRHMQALGNELGACLALLGKDRPTPSALEFATPSFARRLEPTNRVIISQCGSYGDPGSGSNEWIALTSAQARQQLAHFVGDISTAQEDRNCWLGRNRPTFEPRANMSQLTGFDNREYLPPYFPLFRGQDRVFGAMTEFLRPDSLAVDLPFAVPHLPMPRRSWSDSHKGFSLPFTLTYFLNDFVTAEIQRCGARDTMRRNDWLAALFADLADTPTSRIVEWAAANWTQQRIDWLGHLNKALDESSGNTAVTNFLEGFLQQIQASGIRDFHSSPFKGPPSRMEGEAVLEYWRTAWAEFSAGLGAWPEIRAAASESLVQYAG